MINFNELREEMREVYRTTLATPSEKMGRFLWPYKYIKKEFEDEMNKICLFLDVNYDIAIQVNHKSRHTDVVLARQYFAKCMWLKMKNGKHKYTHENIAMFLGFKRHTSSMHLINKIESREQYKRAFEAFYKEYKKLK